MAAKPSTPELTPEETFELRQRLDNVPSEGGDSWRDKLLKVQEKFVETLERPEVAKYFRILYPRKNVKTFESIIEKINTNRRNGEISYDINSLDDLIGAQMLCPYPDDVKKVLDWLYDEREGKKFFQVDPLRKNAEKEKRRREKESGYRAFHICLRLKESKPYPRNLPSGYETYKFELQIKTLLEAAWDGKTHDVIYKERGIEPTLLEHMELISHSLTAIDEQTKLLRYHIEEEKNARNALRRASTLLVFYVSLSKDEREQLMIGDKSIDECQQEDVNRLENGFVNRLENGLKKYQERNGIDRAFCIGHGLLALCTEKLYKQEVALSYISLLVKQAKKGELHRALRARALLRWAFHHIQHSLDDLKYCIDHFDDEDTISDKNDFVFYICDLYKPRKGDINRAQEFLKELEADLNSGKNMLWQIIDTISRFYIRFAKTEDNINKGLMYAQQLNEIEKTEEGKKVSDAFKKYREYLAIKQKARGRRGI